MFLPTFVTVDKSRSRSEARNSFYRKRKTGHGNFRVLFFGKMKLPLALVVGDTLGLGGAGLLGGEGQHHQRNDVGHHVVDGAGDIHGHQEIEAEIDIGQSAEAAEQQRRHLDTVEDLKRRGFSDTAMRDWTFENDNGRNPQTAVARFYAEHWDTMQAENIGYLFWGGVGTGKSYLAGCIANALMEQKIPVRMTNFAAILNDLAASFEGRNEYISRLCRYPLLILDDFGMERDTAYGLEQVYSVIDSRYRSRRPLIVTTNLTLQQIQNPTDTAYARIYDRLLEMCAPVRFTGGNFRRETAQAKLERLKNLMNE